LGHTFVSSPETCGGFSTVTELSLIGLNWSTLDGIERYTVLETLNLLDTEISSLDALSELPALKEIKANGKLYKRLTEMFADTDVTIISQ
jgi:Leucine-rich repeat (LRR) protein